MNTNDITKGLLDHVGQGPRNGFGHSLPDPGRWQIIWWRMDRVGYETGSRCVSKDSAIILRSKLLQLLPNITTYKGKKPNVTKSMYIGSTKTQHSHRVGSEFIADMELRRPIKEKTHCKTKHSSATSGADSSGTHNLDREGKKTIHT